MLEYTRVNWFGLIEKGIEKCIYLSNNQGCLNSRAVADKGFLTVLPDMAVWNAWQLEFWYCKRDSNYSFLVSCIIRIVSSCVILDSSVSTNVMTFSPGLKNINYYVMMLSVKTALFLLI